MTAKKPETTDLIIRLTGEIAESNFDAFKDDALAIIAAADRPLITDEDFAEAEKTVKACSEAEKIIKAAKEEALKEVADITKLFADLDEVTETLRKTRLSLDKQVKNEKAKRKMEIVDSGCERFEKAIDEVAENLPEIHYAISVRRNVFEDAVKGKKNLDSMKEAVDEVLRFEVDRLSSTVKSVTENLAEIDKAEKEFPGLCPDRKNLVENSPTELAAVIEGRIAKRKLEEKEKAEREEAEKLKAEQKQPENNEKEQEPKVEHEQQKPAQEAETSLDKFLLTMTLSCSVEKAKAISVEIHEKYNNDVAVDAIKLARG